MKRAIEENIHQVLMIDGAGKTVLQSWHMSEEIAELELRRAREIYEFEDVWLEKGTDYISPRCQHCESIYAIHRYDMNGIRRGFFCFDCYKNDDVFQFPRGDNHGAQL